MIQTDFAQASSLTVFQNTDPEVGEVGVHLVILTMGDGEYDTVFKTAQGIRNFLRPATLDGYPMVVGNQIWVRNEYGDEPDRPPYIVESRVYVHPELLRGAAALLELAAKDMA